VLGSKDVHSAWIASHSTRHDDRVGTTYRGALLFALFVALFIIFNGSRGR